jgi:hypothetical protein
MNASEEVRRLKSELEHQQSDLREHSAQINQKIQETRAQLTDTYLFRHRVLLLSGVAFGARICSRLSRRVGGRIAGRGTGQAHSPNNVGNCGKTSCEARNQRKLGMSYG